MNETLRHLLQAGLGIWLQSTWLLLLGLGFGRLVHKRSALAASAAYRGTLVSVVVSAVIGAVFAGHIRPLVSIDVPPTAAVAPMLPTMSTPYSIVNNAGTSIGTSTTRPMSTAPTVVPHPSNLTGLRHSIHVPVYGVLVGIWALAAAVQLLWLMVCHLWMWRLRRSATLLTNGPVVDTLRDLANRLHVREPALLLSPTVRSPFVAGIVCPSIYLPTHFADELTAVEIRAILSHELAHVRQNDCLWNVVFRMISAVLWLQPLIWILRRRWQEATEQVCDQWVLSFDCPPSVYADCLLRLAAGLSMPGRGLRPDRVAGVGVFSFKSVLGRRIQAILARTQIRLLSLSRGARTAVAVGTLAAAIATVFLVSTPARSMVRKQIHRVAVINVVAEQRQDRHPAIKGSTAHMKKPRVNSLLPALLALAGGAVQVNLPADATPAPKPAAIRPAKPVVKAAGPLAKDLAVVAQGDTHFPSAPSSNPVMVSIQPTVDTIHVDIGPDGQPLPLSLDFENVPIKQAVKQLFEACHANYAISDDVRGSVNIEMQNVGMLFALREILHASEPVPLTYDFTSGIYHIRAKLADNISPTASTPDSPLDAAEAVRRDAWNTLNSDKNLYSQGALGKDQLDAAQKAYDVADEQAVLQRYSSAAIDIRDYRIPLDHMTASDALALVAPGYIDNSTPKITALVDRSGNAIMMHCTPEQFARVSEAIRNLDVPLASVSINLKFVTASRSDIAKLGFDPSKLAGALSSADTAKLQAALASGKLRAQESPMLTTSAGVPATLSVKQNGPVTTGMTISVTPNRFSNDTISTWIHVEDTSADGPKSTSTHTQTFDVNQVFLSGETGLVAAVQEGSGQMRLVFAKATLLPNVDQRMQAASAAATPAQ